MTTSTSDPPAADAPREAAIRKRARWLGFDLCRFTDIDEAWPAAGRLEAFVDAGRHGEMAWMAETLDRRRHARAMWPDARSAVILGVNYGPDSDPLAVLRQRDRAAISVYARGDDYHALVKGRLKLLAGWLKAKFGGEVKVFVDTAPLMEKPLAERAGAGWQGKHTNLVNREFGSWLFLGVVLTTVELPPDPADLTRCGTCRACLDVCPTQAFPAPNELDARRCISYLTIELEGPIPAEFRPALGNRVYGCDDCLAVCPWNKFAQAGQETRLAARDSLTAPRLADLARLDEAGFGALFTKTAVKRIGRDRLVRNVLYAIGNSGDPALATEARRLLDDPSPVVRGAAVWALRGLAPGSLQSPPPEETNPDVLAEWQAVQVLPIGGDGRRPEGSAPKVREDPLAGFAGG